MKTVTDVRDKLLDFVRADLVGPAHGPNEDLEDQPSIRYSAGVLFPQEVKVNESAAIGGIESDDVENVEAAIDPIDMEEKQEMESSGSEPVDTDYDDTVTLANEYKPSAIGLTFVVPQEALEITVSARAAVYDMESRPSTDGQHQNTIWKRKPLTLEPRSLPLSDAPIKHFTLCDGLSICLRVNERTDRRIVTASLYNTTQANNSDSRTFYHTGFSVRCSDPELNLMAYRDLLEIEALDDEERSLEMMYRDRRVYALGHGCAANWEGGANGAQTVMTETIPSVEVPPVEPRSGDHVYLNMQFLQGGSDDAATTIPVALSALCEEYENWVDAQDERATKLHLKYQGVAASNLRLCRVAAARMRRGVEVLSKDPHALEAFTLANRAILMQQYHSRLPLRKIHDEPFTPPAWGAYDSDWSQKKRGYWRTFQLAFLLMTLPGLVDEHDRTDLDGETIITRDLVDLIWFPTGGGKTEAYLGLSAFLIFWRRLKDPTSVGCKVLMRYTLRLLTSQQFQRAASLISACELIRAKNPERFGQEPVSLGLWVGMSLTPNIEKEAARSVNQLDRKGTEAKNPFQLLSCPWCGTDLTDKKNLGYVVLRGRHRFVCPNSGPPESSCPFSSPLNPLPVCVVDESIYDNPPTLLIGTVDKFAMLAWRKKAGNIFRVGGGPELIIQDELHLISGPLGSMVGLYEGVIDFLCSNPTRPKIIASTATIRRASEQCLNLYARPMFQFPPPALDASDSYFAVENLESPGRLYAGFLPTAASSPLTAQIRSVVALQQGLCLLGHPMDDKGIDPYWTLVQYFGSLKELGRAATFVKADIPEFLPTMHRRYGLSKDDDPDCRRWMNTSEELTSRRNEDEIPKILARLEERYSKTGKFESQALDTVLATNMISVGVDIDRLGLMMIVTQPKGTSEYIQASSRVGRSSSAPGLVLTLYNAGRPRDRSHYEQFRPYHDAFYRYVEPTSVTPFSPPALERALHAVLVIAGRHIARWESPKDIDPNETRFKAFISFLRARVDKVDPEHTKELEDLLERRVLEWINCDAEIWGDITRKSDKLVLMRAAGRPVEDITSDSWEVPTSMRNVDVACGAEVVRYNVE